MITFPVYRWQIQKLQVFLHPSADLQRKLLLMKMSVHTKWSLEVTHYSQNDIAVHGVLLFGTLWTAACQASLFITNPWSLLKLMSTESVMPSNHLILCHPLLFPPSIFPSIRVFSNESVLCIKWPTTGVLFWHWYQDNASLTKWVCECSLLFNFSKMFQKGWC